MATLLFFDDRCLHRRDNLRRRIGRPELIPGSTYVDRSANLAWAYPTVFQDPEAGKWRMTYQGFVYDGPALALLAESDDGLHWEPRDTTKQADLPDRMLPHQILPGDRFHEWGVCLLDPYASPEERIKGFVIHSPSDHETDTYLWVSADGLRWSCKQGVHWQKEGPDPATAGFWNEVRQNYTLTTRPMNTDRRIAVAETADWQTFTEPELALQADALDSPLCELYGMPAFPYEGYFVGLLWLFHVDPRADAPNKYLNGHVDCQLAYSINGWHWQRALRDPFVPNGRPGAPDAGCVYPSCLISEPGGDLRIYACCSTHEHGHIPRSSGSIVCYRLRRDGFVYLESTGGAGLLGTRPILWRQGELTLNVQCPAGLTRVQVSDENGQPLKGYSFDDCLGFSGDDTAWSPQWKGGKGTAGFAGTAVRIEVEINSGRLYGICGAFQVLTGLEARRVKALGQPPEARRGF